MNEEKSMPSLAEETLAAIEAISLSLDKASDVPDCSIQSIPELRAYGDHLKEASELLSALHRRLGEQTQQACKGWNDANAQAFMKDFEDSKEQIDLLAKKMSNFSTYISSICGKFDELMAGIKY